MDVYLIRHGQTNYNLRLVINEDPKKPVFLNALGKEQAKQAAEEVKSIHFDAIFSSEFPRAKQTAAIINKYHRLPVKIDTRLNESRSGFEGRNLREFLEYIGEDIFTKKPPHGESFQEVKTRLLSFIQDIRNSDYEKVLLVSHAEPLQIINGYFMQLSDRESYAIQIDNCQIIRHKL